jgi:hypothetical protein
MEAVYTDDERRLMGDLTVREQTIIHVLKALVDGEIQEMARAGTSAKIREPCMAGSLSELQPPTSYGDGPLTFTAPDDIPFGEEPVASLAKKPRPLYALVWTWKGSQVYKTKGMAQKCLMTWKKCYEARGWKVHKNGADSYIASLADLRHAVSLHAYDTETHQRLS